MKFLENQGIEGELLIDTAIKPLQITRQAIYDWKSGKAIPSTKNQERINKLQALEK